MKSQHKNNKPNNTSRKGQDDAQRYTVRSNTNLLEFLQKMYAGKGVTSLKQLVKRGCVQLDGKVCQRIDLPLKTGQSVSIHKTGSKPPKATMRSNPLQLTGIKVLFEDADLIVVDKPAGLLTMGTVNDKANTAYRALSNYLKASNPTDKIFIVHRLDRDTSGVLVFAKNIETRDALQQNWQSEEHVREYFALVSGKVAKPKATITSWLRENNSFHVTSSQIEGNGQYAITHYHVIGQNEQYSLLKVNLETGRKNQIRVHLQDIGHPIVGDKRYGNEQNPIKRLGLHAALLSFKHPKTNKMVRFESPVIRAFYRAVE